MKTNDNWCDGKMHMQKKIYANLIKPSANINKISQFTKIIK